MDFHALTIYVGSDFFSVRGKPADKINVLDLPKWRRGSVIGVAREARGT